jgi:hypothetical protein
MNRVELAAGRSVTGADGEIQPLETPQSAAPVLTPALTLAAFAIAYAVAYNYAHGYVSGERTAGASGALDDLRGSSLIEARRQILASA